MSPGIDDEEVLGAANEHDALLLTADKDFGVLVFRLGRVSRGDIRLSGIAAEEQVAVVSTRIHGNRSTRSRAPGRIQRREFPHGADSTLELISTRHRGAGQTHPVRQRETFVS